MSLSLGGSSAADPGMQVIQEAKSSIESLQEKKVCEDEKVEFGKSLAGKIKDIGCKLKSSVVKKLEKGSDLTEKEIATLSED